MTDKARRDYALLDTLPDNLDAIREAAERAVEASDLSPETKAFLRTNRERQAATAAAPPPSRRPPP